MTFFKNKKIYYVVFITLLIGFSSFFIYKKTSFDSFKNIEKKEISKYSKEQFIKNTLKDKNVFGF